MLLQTAMILLKKIKNEKKNCFHKNERTIDFVVNELGFSQQISSRIENRLYCASLSGLQSFSDIDHCSRSREFYKHFNFIVF